MIFLAIFSYTLLFKFDKLENFDSNDSNQSSAKQNNSDRGTLSKSVYNLKISNYEILLLIWIFSIFLKEMREVIIFRDY